MMRFTRFLVVAAKRSATSAKLGKSVGLTAALSPKQRSLPRVSVTKLMKPSGSGKHVTSSFLLKDKKKVATAKVAVPPKKKRALKVRKGRSSGKKAAALYVRFYHALKKSGLVKGKRRMQKTGELWRATKKAKDFKKRVEAAMRLAKKGQKSRARKLKAQKKAKGKKSAKGVRRVYRRVSRKKTVTSTVPPLP
ncbi:hypothetical protein TcYC6_0122760 [Trypanosoma cruzi]|nr:hypothetical protein TcYC6_0122760 [Trypanosoma cruzi]